jgi:hypothetical protein
MATYYLDIEAYCPGPRPDIENDKIITIQYQKIDLGTGKPLGDLMILREWESSEEEIVTEFYRRFVKGRRSAWDFIPVGCNLNFELEFLTSKFKKYLGKEFSSRDVYYHNPRLDVQPFLILMNKGEFRGASLDRFTSKVQNGACIKDYYEKKEYDRIDEYIIQETAAFIEFLQKLDANIGKLRE